MKSFPVGLLLVVLSSLCHAHITEIRIETGGFVAGLSVPPAGIHAGETTELFVRIRRFLHEGSGGQNQSEQFESLTEATACSELASQIVMPSMAGMPAIVPVVRSLGYPGSYGLKAVFPHGGFYRLNLTFTSVTQPASVQVAFGLDVTDETTDLSAEPKPFALTVSHSGRIFPGKPTPLSLSVWSRDTGEMIRKFDVVHEKLVHLIVVRDDLGQFFHEHPVQQPDGTFFIEVTFPTAGNWRLFADMAPEGAGSQVAIASLTVNGRSRGRERLEPTIPPAITQGDSVLVLPPTPVVARRPASLVFELRDARGETMSDLEPWLGAAAHLILIEKDAVTFVHAHPEGNGVVTHGGVLIFESRFPKPGIYKAWMQFQRAGRIVTLPFVIRVLNNQEN